MADCFSCSYFRPGPDEEHHSCTQPTVQYAMLLGEERQHLRPSGLARGCPFYSTGERKRPAFASYAWDAFFEKITGTPPVVRSDSGVHMSEQSYTQTELF